MKQIVIEKGYQQGRQDGFVRGKAAGLQQGLQDALSFKKLTPPVTVHPPSEEKEITPELIIRNFGLHQLNESFQTRFGKKIKLQENGMECLKDTFKSSIWKLHLRLESKTIPIILKIFKPHSSNDELNLTELNIYTHTQPVLYDVVPDIYCIQHGVNGNDTWVYMEYVNPIKGQVQFNPGHFDSIIPALAGMHARTFEEQFYKNEDIFMPWMRMYNEAESYNERNNTIEDTLEALSKAKQHSETKELIAPVYRNLRRALRKGPLFFRPLLEAGQCVIHNDLQTTNIGCNRLVANEPWQIKFLDWEGARFEPCWFDVYNLIGVFLAYRSDWRNEEEQILEHGSRLYAAEMSKYGINFEWDAFELYKMAYLQRILEKTLLMQLNWAMDGNNKGALLQGSIDRLNRWGKELDLL